MQTNYEMKKHNTVKIFRTLKECEKLSRKEISSKTGLSWGSVSSITNELLLKNIIVAEKDAPMGGRPAEILTLNPTKFLQLGIDINSIGITFAVVNLLGKTLHDETTHPKSFKKDDIITTLFDFTEKILSSFPNIIGINLSMQGKINRTEGVSIRANFSDNWHNVPLVEIFEKRFALPTKLYHDPDCLLYYHLYNDKRLVGKNDGFVIRLENGIGMARLLHGTLYNSGNVTSYEFGHIISQPDGRLCDCGKHGCLESYVSIRGLREIYREQKSADCDFITDLKNNQPEAVEILKNGLDRLSVAIANLFTLSAPEFIMLDGILLTINDSIFEEIAQKTQLRLLENCNLLKANYKRTAPAVGSCLITQENTEALLFNN